ncbi:MAG: ABC transporter permease, partial [Candidatus Aenigmatarchaeota archaeon]
MNDMHGFQLIMNFVIFPIFGLSGALFPIETLPGWLKIMTLLDPLTYGVEGVRYGLLGTSSIDPILCLAVLSCFAAAMLTLGAYLFRKINI